MNLNKAFYLKPILIQYIIEHNKKSILGSELRFGSLNLFADLISLSNNRISSYEIKSRGDDLRDINNQLKKYRKVFDYVYIVVTENHLAHAKSVKLDWCGILLINNEKQVKLIKKAKLIRSQSKDEILHSMTLGFLWKLVETNKLKIQGGIRKYLKRESLAKLKKQYRQFLETKLLERNHMFYKELGKQVHIEDVSLLSFLNNAKVLNES